MKFDELYPDSKPDLRKSYNYQGSDLFKYGELKPCCNCGELTDWIDMSFEANLCSEECEYQKWREFGNAYNNVPPDSKMAYGLHWD